MNEIDRIVDELEEFIDRGRASTFSQNKVTVDKRRLLGYVDELKLRIPEQIRMAQRIVENEESILKKAGEKATDIIQEAKNEADQIVDESVLIERAYEKADEIVRSAEAEREGLIFSANNDATVIRKGALSYAAEMLAEIQKINQYSLSSLEKVFGSVMDAVKSNLEDLEHNRKLIERELGGLKEEENYPKEEDFRVDISSEDFLEEENMDYEED